jgi:hypothetical protein
MKHPSVLLAQLRGFFTQSKGDEDMNQQTILGEPTPVDPAPVEASRVDVQKGKLVKARVLVGCEYGEPDDLVEIESGEAKQAKTMGKVDTHKDAVAYAASLPQNTKA